MFFDYVSYNITYILKNISFVKGDRIMREYKMPTDISEKEKIIGGVLTAGQLIFLGIGLGITTALGLALAGAFGGFAFVISALIGVPFGVVFAFVSPHKMPMLTYIRLKIKHRRQECKLPSHNSDIDDVELNYFEIERL